MMSINHEYDGWGFRAVMFVMLALLAMPLQAGPVKIKVACMGDSITYGAGITGAGTSPATWNGDSYLYEGPTLLDQDSYPEFLQGLLGADYDVRNFGASGRTVTGPGAGLYPYLNSVRDGNTPSGGYTAGVAFAPDIVLLMLGTNDTKTQLWATAVARFRDDYTAMIRALQALPSKPCVVVCYPIAVEDSPKPHPASGITESNRVSLLPLINQVVDETGAGFINTNPGMPPFTGLLSDQVHPNRQGALQLARIMDAGLPSISRDPQTGVPVMLGTRPRIMIQSPSDRAVVRCSDVVIVEADAWGETTTGIGIGSNAPSLTPWPVSKVEFYCDGVKFGESTNTPYSCSLSNLVMGSHQIKARATNSANLARESDSITLYVAAQALPSGGVPFFGIYTQSFDGLVREVKTAAVAWSNNVTLPGWYGANFVSGAWSPVTTYQGDDGSSNTQLLKSLGPSWGRNRSMGTIAYSSPMAWGVCLVNATSSTVSQITVSYTGEQWRVSSSSANNKPVSFDYSTLAPTLGTSSNYVAVPALGFQPPVPTNATTIVLNGKAVTNRCLIQQTITIAGGWAPGGMLWLRWSTGSGQSSIMALDDLCVTAGGAPAATTSIALADGNIQIGWKGVAGSRYVVQSTTNLLSFGWEDISAVIPLSGNAWIATNFLHAQDALGGLSRFYRLCLVE